MGKVSCWSVLTIYVKNINSNKNRETPLEASMQVDLEGNTEKAKHMVVSRHQNVGQNQCVLIATKSFNDMAKFKCLRTSTNRIHEESKSV
jgi:hypothetical protein